MESWFNFPERGDIPSPSLLLYPRRIEENIKTMIGIAGNPDRLRPHVKTHKTAEIIRLQMEAGIAKFKCATVAEAEMAASEGASDVLLAYQPVGPNIKRVVQLVKTFPKTDFSVIVDNSEVVKNLAEACNEAVLHLMVLIDLDVGMRRSGIPPDDRVVDLFKAIKKRPGVIMSGFHVYDGHLHQSSLEERRKACKAAMEPVFSLQRNMRLMGMEVRRIVAGGTPTFPIHAATGKVECSPGTCLLWDFGYGDRFPELNFSNAALVLTRVIDKPGDDRLCLDLGHKAIAAEQPSPHARFPQIPDAREIMQSEEHLVIETEHAEEWRIGDGLFGIPRHICPTCALYDEAVVIEDGHAVGRWKIAARNRKLTI